MFVFDYMSRVCFVCALYACVSFMCAFDVVVVVRSCSFVCVSC